MYCYKCGVKLEDNEKECPLCHSLLPIDDNYNLEKAYSDKLDLRKHFDFKYISKLLLLILIFLGFVTVICNICIEGKISWSIYVISSLVYLSSQVSFLYFKNKLIPAIFNLIGLEYLLFTIAYLNNGLEWYLYLVLPNIFVVWLLTVLCIIVFIKRKMRLTRGVSFILFVLSIILIVTEILIDLYKYQIINLKWSIYASIPILILSLIIFGISFNKSLIDEIKKRVFI